MNAPEKNIQKRAESALKAIVKNLSDRCGLRNAWDEVDEDTQQEIIRTWTAIVVRKFE